MPQRVQVEGFGPVDFPDEFTPEQMQAAWRKSILPLIEQQERIARGQAAALEPQVNPNLAGLQEAGAALKSAAGSVGQGAVQGVTAFPKLIAGGGAWIDRHLLGQPEATPEKSQINQGAEMVDQEAARLMPTQPRFADQFVAGDVAQGFGSMLPAMAAGGAAGLISRAAGTVAKLAPEVIAQRAATAAGRAATATMIPAEYADAYQRAREQGDDADTAFAKSLGYAGVAAAIENHWGVGRLARKYFPDPQTAGAMLGKMGVSKEVAKDFLSNYAEEFSQRVAQDLIVEGKTDFKGAQREGMAGGVAGALIGLPGNVGRMRGVPAPQPVPEKGTNPLVSQRNAVKSELPENVQKTPVDLADLQKTLRENQGAALVSQRNAVKSELPENVQKTPVDTAAIRLRAVVPEGQPAAELTIEPLTEAGFNTWLARKNPLIQSLDDWQAAHPQDTHIAIVRKADGTVSGAKAGSLKELLPAGVGTDWREVGETSNVQRPTSNAPEATPAPVPDVAAAARPQAAVAPAEKQATPPPSSPALAALPPELTSPAPSPKFAAAAEAAPGTIITGPDEGKASLMPAETGASPVQSAPAAAPSSPSLHPRQLEAQNKLAQAQAQLEAVRRKGKGQSNYAFKLRARIAKLTRQAAKPPPVRRANTGGAARFSAEREFAQADDILDWTVDQGGVLSRSGYQQRFGKEKYAANKSLYDDAPKALAAPHHNKIFGTETPDNLAQAAYRAHLIDEPTVGAYWAAVADASRVRLQARQSAAKEEARYVADIKAGLNQPEPEDDVVYSRTDTNRELNELRKMPAGERTAVQSARLEKLEREAGQGFMFDEEIKRKSKRAAFLRELIETNRRIIEQARREQVMVASEIPGTHSEMDRKELRRKLRNWTTDEQQARDQIKDYEREIAALESPEAVDAQKQRERDRAEVERRRAERLTASPIETTDNLFGERQQDKAGQGMFFSKTTDRRPQTAGLTQAEVEAHLAEAHGAPPGGVVRVVDEPDAGFDGRAVFDRETGDLLRIEVNAAQVSSPADVDRVLAHEIAHIVWRDGGVREVLDTLTPGERAEIARDLKELGYEPHLRDEEGGARGIEALVNAWRGRSWFGQVVGRVLAWASEHGLKLTRRAAEFIAARTIAKTQANVLARDEAEQAAQSVFEEVAASRTKPVKVPAGPITETEGFKRWFRASKVVDADGKPRRVYHGTKRPDRVGSRFRAARATSGPMSFFTDDPEIGSKYATGKADTSLEHPDDYSGWFKFKPEGSRGSVPIDRAWWFLTQEQREKLADTLPRVSNINEAGDSMEDGQFRLTPPGETGLMPADSWAYELRQARGNSLKAAVEAWLNSGALFNREEEFLDVLRTAGLTGVEFDSPWAEYPSVYPVYLSIQNPLVTSAIPTEVLDALHENGKRKRAKPYGTDQWDKSTVSGPDWLERLDGDQQDGTTHAWTSVPDWVTDTLRDFGYDGIHDTGGKQGGPAHTVWIPFAENQVKSATGNRGTFDPEKVDIRESRVKRSSGPVESLKQQREDAIARGAVYAGQIVKLESEGKRVPKSLREAAAAQVKAIKEATFQMLRHPDFVAEQVRAVDAKLVELNRLKDRQRILKQQGSDLESDERARLGELNQWLPEESGVGAVPFADAAEFAGIPPSLVAQAVERTPGLKFFVTQAERKRMNEILDNPNLTPAQRQTMLDDLERNRGRALAALPLPTNLPPGGNVALATSTTLAGNADPSTFWQQFKKWLRQMASPTPEIPLLGPQSRWNAPMRGFRQAVRSGTLTAQHDAEVMVKQVLEPLLALPRKQLDPNALTAHANLARKLQFAEKRFEAQAEAMRAEIDSLEQSQADRAAIRERREALAEFEANPPAKIAELQRRLAEAQGKLAENPMHLFKLAVLYNDYESRFQMLQPKQKGAFKFPGGLTIEEIVSAHARVNAAIEASPAKAAIKEAMDRHYRLMADLEQRLLDHGLLIPEDMKNGAYFPHQVLDYTSQHLARLKPTTEERFRGYLVDPVGSRKAIETDYLQAVYRHAAEVLADNAHQDAVAEWIEPLDISAKVKANVEAMAAASGRQAGAFEWRSPDNLPPGYRLFDKQKLALRMGLVLDPKVLADALQITLKSGDVIEQLRTLVVDFTVTADMLQTALVAGQREPWVLPNEIADALDGLLERQQAEDVRSRSPIYRAQRKAMALWKWDILHAPWHFVRYTWGNVVSDVVDKVMGADPGMALYLPRAFREVVDFVDNDKATPELRAAFEHSVLDTITFAEVAKVKDSPAFEQLRSDTQRARALAGNFARGATMPIIPLVRLLTGAKVRSTTDLSHLREASFRYAKFLADLERIKAEKDPVYAGAYWKDVEQERTPEAKAAFIARRTFGDYGDMSVSGDWLRKNLVPFYSWTEVNFRYHTNLLKNFGDMIRRGEFGHARDAARASAAYLALRLLLPYLAFQLWNTIGGKMAGAWDDDDLEATLSEADRRKFHITLGKDARGQTRVIYLPTAFTDLINWFGGDNLARLFVEYSRGDITFERLAGDYAKSVFPNLGNQVAQGTGPLGKGAFIAASGKNPFPDITNMRSVSGKEKWFAVLQTMTDREGTDLLRRIFDNDYYPRPANEVMSQLILQIRRRDPEQWAYYEVKEKVGNWKYEKTGKRHEGGDYTAPEAEALRNFRRAVYLGDVDAAERFYTRLLGFGYTAERLRQSIQHQAPLAELNAQERPEFIRSLDRADREQLRRAVQYWERLGALKGKEAGLFPKKGQKTFTPQPDRLRGAVETFERKGDDEVKRTAERMVESALSGRGR